jgi:hypothetical protein
MLETPCTDCLTRLFGKVIQVQNQETLSGMPLIPRISLLLLHEITQ